MDLSEGAINKIESLVKNNLTTQVDGITYSAQNLNPVIYEPEADAIEIHSLRGFCDYINSNFDRANVKESCLVIVDGIKQVRLVSRLSEKKREREVLIGTKIDDALETFPFGDFMSQEEFAIRFRSSFVQKKGDDTEYILRYASKLSGGTTVELEDDGVTQNVGVKAGVSGALVEKKDMKPIVKLSPFRTFREIEQPESEFLFRVRIDSNNVPKLALFEADGGAWRSSAMSEIAEYISSMCSDVKIIA
jgi:hypothetical protein